MGQQTSKQTVESEIRSGVSSAVSIVMSDGKVIQSITAHFKNCNLACTDYAVKHAPELCNLDITNFSTFNTKMVQDAFVSQAVKQDIANSATQASKQTLQSIGMPNSQQASNLTDMYSEAFTKITADISQNCMPNLDQYIDFDCDGSDFTNRHITMTNSSKSVTDCAQKARVMQDAITHITNHVDQDIAQYEKNSLWAVAAIILATAVLVISPGIMVAKAGKNPAVTMGLFALVSLVWFVYLNSECSDKGAGIKILGFRFPPHWCKKKWKTKAMLVSAIIFLLGGYALFTAAKQSFGGKAKE